MLQHVHLFQHYMNGFETANKNVMRMCLLHDVCVCVYICESR